MNRQKTTFLGRVRKRAERLNAGLRNALEVGSIGGSGLYQSPFDVLHEDPSYRLRRYLPAVGDPPRSGRPVLLVPPLMVASEIYDIEPELSAIKFLLRRGLDVWVTDFGAPELEEHGLARTLDDHVRAVSDAVDRVHAETGRDVHLSGYSQGGMFVYQAAAYRRSKNIASIITFGSPVDIHRNLPKVHAEWAERFIEALRHVVEPSIARVEGLPGALTSTVFKLLSVRKEVQQMMDFVQHLHDREALEQQARRRRFLAGEGFVAWPGPALRQFVDEMIVHNRMASGGFVIDGRTVTLADIEVPMLVFLGLRDDLARPASVRGIHGAAPRAKISEVAVRAGHFGLVVGSKSLEVTWPTVTDWIRYQDGEGVEPMIIRRASAPPADLDEVEDAAFEDMQLDLELVSGALVSMVGGSVDQLGRAATAAARGVDNLRYQVPRLGVLRRLTPDQRVNVGRALEERASAAPTDTFFLAAGRAFSYRDADRRVDNVVKGLIDCGVRPGHRVAVVMHGRPSFLSLVAALSRLGAVAVLVDPEEHRLPIERAFSLVPPDAVVCDPESIAGVASVYAGDILVLGGGGQRRDLDPRAKDMEAIDPDQITLPSWYQPNPGRASELAMVMFTAGRDEKPKASYITNRRWAIAAYGTAAACTLKATDTVYNCLPLYHPAGMLVSVGAALVSGSRLALANRFDVDLFWQDVRRYGATVVFYAGDMCRALVHAKTRPAEQNHPVRLFAGSGLRRDVWERMHDRFGPAGILEFYASTEGSCVLANASGLKVGAMGRPLPGTSDVVLAAYDFSTHEFIRDANGFCLVARDGEPGVLLARLDGVDVDHLMRHRDEEGRRARILRDAFEEGDVWYETSDLLRRDEEGDYWFVDRVRDVLDTDHGPVFPRQVEDRLYAVDGVDRCAAYGVMRDGVLHVVVAVVPREDRKVSPARIAEAVRGMSDHERPTLVYLRDALPSTDGYRVVKAALAAEGWPSDVDVLYEAPN